jgi:hypothetical protein
VQHSSDFRYSLRRPLQSISFDAIGCGIDVVENFFDQACKLVNILRIDRRNESLVQAMVNLTQRLVTAKLEVVNFPRHLARLRRAAAEPAR